MNVEHTQLHTLTLHGDGFEVFNSAEQLLMFSPINSKNPFVYPG